MGALPKSAHAIGRNGDEVKDESGGARRVPMTLVDQSEKEERLSYISRRGALGYVWGDTFLRGRCLGATCLFGGTVLGVARG